MNPQIGDQGLRDPPGRLALPLGTCGGRLGLPSCGSGDIPTGNHRLAGFADGDETQGLCFLLVGVLPVRIHLTLGQLQRLH